MAVLPPATSRSEGKRTGNKRYLSVCKYHGECFRWTSNGCCNECNRKQSKLHKTKYQDEYRKKRNKWSSDNPEKAMLQGARKRAKTSGVPFNLLPSDIVIPDVCPVLGIKLERHGECIDTSPSVDRIVGALGYVSGNIKVISHRANKLKSDSTLDEMRRVLAYMEKSIAC